MLRLAEQQFRHFLSGYGRNPPPLTDVAVDEDAYTSELIFRVELGGVAALGWRVPRRDLDHTQVASTRENLGAMVRELYNRLRVDFIVELETRAQRMRFHAFAAGPRHPEDIERERERLEIAERQIRHRLDRARREFARPDGIIEYQTDRHERGGMYILGHIAELMFGGGAEFDQHAKERAEVRTKAETLLRAWLSPEQLAEYDQHDCFEVIGSDTATRYRIEKGVVQNVFELDEHGRKVSGWCFAPGGDLAPGDVMLGQKIALENYERETRAIANRFGDRERDDGYVMVREYYSAMARAYLVLDLSDSQPIP